jgi:hypothetical protein
MSPALFITDLDGTLLRDGEEDAKITFEKD